MQSDNIQPWGTPFLILNQSIVSCPVLTVASCPAYRFLRRQVVSCSHLFKNFSVCCDPHSQSFYHSQRSRNTCFFSLEFSFFFCDPTEVGNLISGSSAFSKSSMYIWKFSVHILLKYSLKDFEHYHVNVWSEYNCMVVWTFFGIAFLRNWNENWPFPVLWPLLSFPNLLAYWV